MPYIERVQASLGRSGLFVVRRRLQDGLTPDASVDCGSGSLLLVSAVSGATERGELEEAVESALRVDVELRAVYRESDDGQSERIAEGYERQVPMALEEAGESQRWMARRFVVRSLCHAKASEAAPSRPRGESASGSAQSTRPRSQTL
jgi:hypothetical protein